jgi:hypothetical protein
MRMFLRSSGSVQNHRADRLIVLIVAILSVAVDVTPNTASAWSV